MPRTFFGKARTFRPLWLLRSALAGSGSWPLGLGGGDGPAGTYWTPSAPRLSRRLALRIHDASAGLLAHPALPWIVFLAVLAVPILWGADPRFGWDVDNIAPGSVLKGMAARFGPGWYSSYGPLPYYLTAILYAPILLLAKLTGQLGTPSATYPWGFANPDAWMTALVVAARALPLAMALAVAAAFAQRERAPKAERSTLLTLALLTGAAAFVYYSRTSNVDLHALFWIALGFTLAGRHRPGLRTLCLAAAAAAAGVCSKEQVAPFSVVIVAYAAKRAWTSRLGRSTDRASASPRRRWLRVALVAGAAVATYVVLWQLPWNLSGWRAHHDFVFNAAKYPRVYPLTPSGVLALGIECCRQLPLALGWPVLVGVAMGASRRAPVRDLLPQAAATLLYFAGFVATVGYVFPRFLLPVLVFAVPYAVRGWNAVMEEHCLRPRVRGALIAALFGLAILGGPALDARMLSDSRYRVEAWLARLPKSTVVEVIGNPHFQARVPDGLRTIQTRWDSLAARPRAPRGDVVLVSHYDGTADRIRAHATLRRTFWDRLVGDGPAGYRAMTFPSSPLGLLSPDLPVDPATTVYVRSRLDPS